MGITKVCSSITENAVMGHGKAGLGLQRPEGRGRHKGKGTTAPRRHAAFGCGATQASAPHASQALLVAPGDAVTHTALSERLPQASALHSQFTVSTGDPRATHKGRHSPKVHVRLQPETNGALSAGSGGESGSRHCRPAEKFKDTVALPLAPHTHL